jgi:hypothetical protein
MSLGAAASGWVENAAAFLESYFKARKLPLAPKVDQLLFALYPVEGEGGGYILSLRLEMDNTAALQALARLIQVVGNLYRGAGSEDPLLDIFFAGEPLLDGNGLVLFSSLLSSGQTTLLFNELLVY